MSRLSIARRASLALVPFLFTSSFAVGQSSITNTAAGLPHRAALVSQSRRSPDRRLAQPATPNRDILELLRPVIIYYPAKPAPRPKEKALNVAPSPPTLNRQSAEVSSTLSPVIIYYRAFVPREAKVTAPVAKVELKEAPKIEASNPDPVADIDSDLISAINAAYVAPVAVTAVPAVEGRSVEPAKKVETENPTASVENAIVDPVKTEPDPVANETPAVSNPSVAASPIEPVTKEGKTEPSVVSEIKTEAGPKTLPSSAADLNNSAVAFTKESRYEEALDLLRTAIVSAPDSYRLHRNLSIVYENMKRLDEAVLSAEAAVRLAPREPSALIQLCGLLVITQKILEAVGCYERLDAVQPMDSMDQTFYGVALFRSGKIDSAVSVLEKAAASPSVASATLNALGVCYYEKKRFSDAVTTFKQAVDLTPDHPRIRFNLAIAQLAVQNKEGALSQYRLLKTDDPKLAAQLYQILFSGKVISVEELKH